MQMACYRVKVPDSARLSGFTAAGQRAAVVPGEHVVHRIRPKVDLHGIVEALRFLGADSRGRDVHVPLPAGVELEALLTVAETGAGQGEGCVASGSLPGTPRT